MSTFVTLQLNASPVAGDWATRSAGAARTATSLRERPAAPRSAARRELDELAVHLCGLRGAIESVKRGPCGPSVAITRTGHADVTYGSPALYRGMWFALGSA
jgi:hypothetical protein